MLENTASSGCLDSRSWNQSVNTSNAPNSYQNLSGYYSNIDYLGASMQQQLVGFNHFVVLIRKMFNVNNVGFLRFLLSTIIH